MKKYDWVWLGKTDEVCITVDHEIFAMLQGDSVEEKQVARIVACLNFCEGYDADILEKGPSLKELIAHYPDQVTRWT